MIVGVTGATGFVGRYIVAALIERGYKCRCWFRDGSDRGGFEDLDRQITWVHGELGNPESCYRLCEGCDALIHAAYWRPGPGFQDAEGDVVEFARRNVLGTLELIEEARACKVPKFLFISSGAVHEKILSDRPLDETHPLWPRSHYGAYKASIEKFISSYGASHGMEIAALRPTGVYGLARPVSNTKWYSLVRDIVLGKPVDVQGGGKEVHAGDVGLACVNLLEQSDLTGESFECCDRYVSHWEVAHLARRLAGTDVEIRGQQASPRHEIVTTKIERRGVRFGGTARLESVIQQLVAAIQQQPA